MTKAIHVTGYFIGVVLILIGILITTEFVLQLSSESRAPYVIAYPIIGPILIIIGGMIYYDVQISEKKYSKIVNEKRLFNGFLERIPNCFGSLRGHLSMRV